MLLEKKRITLCLPKEEGGLGFRSLTLWNKTLCLKLIWRLLDENDSLWAQWLKKNRLKEGVIWLVDEKKQSSWTWKTILHLRPLANRFIRCRLGNGEKLSFWCDWWTDLGPLIDLMGASGPSQTGIPINSSVAQACTHTGWNLRPARSPQAEMLHTHLTTVPSPALSTVADSYVWNVDNEECHTFNTKRTWESLRNRGDKLAWAAQVWFKGAIPRHAFIMWLTHLDRLPTRARLHSWGLNVDTACCLCGLYYETRDHIFLHCEVTEELWLRVTKRLGYVSFTFHTWEAFEAWLDIKDSKSPITLWRLVAQATIYTIWRERNNRYHNGSTTETNALFKALDRLIRDAILAEKKRKRFRNLMHEWLKYD